jgi:hypothetical protein
MPAPILIELEPTKRFEELNGVKLRVYVGRTNTGVPLEMLGLFRISDPLKRAEFEKAVCTVAPADPNPVTLLSDYGLVNP